MNTNFFQISTGYDTLPPKGSAATEEVVFNLSNSLSKHVKVDVVGVGKNNFTSKHIKFHQIKLPKWLLRRTNPRTFRHILKRVYYSFVVLLLLSRIVNKNSKTIVHFHNQYNCFIFLLFKWIVSANVKVVYTCHNPLLSLDNKDKSFKVHFMERFCFKYTDLTIALSSKAYENVKHYSASVVTLSNGVNLREFYSKFKLHKKELRLLFTGRITPVKNQMLLLRALKLIAKKMKNVKLVLVGPIDDDTYYAKLIDFVKRENLSGNFSYLGEVNRKTIINQYKKNDIFVVPSITEGMSLSILEAMASNKPLFVYKKEYVKGVYNGKNCVLFKNVKELVDKILYCKSHPKCFTKLVKNEREYIREYSWDNISKRLLDIYRKL